MASQLNNMLLSEGTSLLLQQFLEAQQQRIQTNPSQEQTLHETDTEFETTNENEAQESTFSDNDFNELLINEVQSMPILWLRNCPDYKRADKKKIVWSNIAKTLKCDGEYSLRHCSCSLLYYT